VNGLFAMALEALGIPYRFVAARPMFYPARRPKTHMAFIAEVESRQWLCDLGFGSYGIRAPMALDTLDVDITQDFDTFRLSRSARANICFRRRWRMGPSIRL
jgi:N-hydroxyarylamine O-acetyltransferase